MKIWISTTRLEADIAEANLAEERKAGGIRGAVVVIRVYGEFLAK